MADLEVNDLDFYQTDYTTASPWESFNFNLEEVSKSWLNVGNPKVRFVYIP